MKPVSALLVAAACTLWFGTAYADPWKDESGHGWSKAHKQDEYWKHDKDRDRGDYGKYKREKWEAREYGKPYGHKPPPGECRAWDYDRPAGHQGPPFKC